MQANPTDLIYFIVRSDRADTWSVFEQGFEQPIAEFEDAVSAEQYAWSLAATKLNWKIDVFDSLHELVGTFNSEDDAMPKATLP